jgi:hypothetical protein
MPTQPQTPWEEIVGQAMDDCVAVFGEGAAQVTYTHAGGGAPYPVDGIFEAATEEVDIDTGAAVLSNQPRISFKLAVLQELPDQGDTLLIRGKSYRVIEPEFDGQGTVTLRLHEA